MSLNNYFFGSEIAKKYDAKIDSLADKLSGDDLVNEQRTFKILKWIDVGVCKYGPTAGSFLSLSYGLYSENFEVLFWGVLLSESAR
ncbi:hypothetical protein COV11_00150, partial [Candidatus Woesearchaeota archaeon CG10_big_fil_rev_8_21_14_0_10_30_7]